MVNSRKHSGKDRELAEKIVNLKKSGSFDINTI